MTRKVHTTIWVGIAILIGFGLGFVLINGSIFVAQNIHKVNLSFNFGPEVIIVDQGGPAVTDFDTTASVQLKRYVVHGGTAFPDISAPTFLIGDVKTGQIIASRQKDSLRPIASLTKLMTAVVADETLGLSEETAVSGTAVSTYGNSGRLSRGQVFTLEELLLPLLLESSNDAAEVIAEHENRYTFMLDMNAKAQELGMENTSFEDPSGLSAKNVSTVEDLFKLVKYIDKYRSFILDISAQKSGSARKMTWYSNSRFRSYKDYVGGKNGYTDEAGKTNIAIFRLPLEGEEKYRDIAIIIFDTRNAETDTRKIVSYLNNYVYYE